MPEDLLAAKLNDGTAEDWFLTRGWGTRALLAYRSKRPEAAIEYANEADKNNPGKAAHAYNLAVIALAKKAVGDEEAAEQAMEELSQLVDTSEFDNGLLMAKILMNEATAKFKEN